MCDAAGSKQDDDAHKMTVKRVMHGIDKDNGASQHDDFAWLGCAAVACIIFLLPSTR